MPRTHALTVARSLALLSTALLLALACGSSESSGTGLRATIGGAGNGASSGGKSGIGDVTATSGKSGIGDVTATSGKSGIGDTKGLGDEVFDESVVRSYHLTIPDDEYAKLMDLSTLLVNPYTVNEDRYVKATLSVGEQSIPSIGVRFKGQFSIWGCVDFATGTRRVRVEPVFRNIDVCQRFSLKLDLDRYDDSARLNGLKKLNLHAMSADPSKMRERLGYSLYRDMDVLAPRAVHARVYINGQYHGLFAAVEEVDGRFTANRFPHSGDGNLYKEIWPAEHVTKADVIEALRTNDAPDVMDVSDFLAFKEDVTASTEADFSTKMAPHLDFDYLARTIVVNRAINDFDGVMSFYFGWGPPPANHNLYWYHDTESGRFMLIPWDLDKTFWYPEPNFWSDNSPNGLNIAPNWNVVTKSCNGYTVWFDNLDMPYQLMAIDCDPLMRLLRAKIYDRQKALVDAFISGPFSEERIKTKLAAWQLQIADAIKDDPLIDSDQWKASVAALSADLPKLQQNVRLMMSGLIEE